MPHGAKYSYKETNHGEYDLFVMDTPIGGYSEVHFTRNCPGYGGPATWQWDHVTFVVNAQTSLHVYVSIQGPSYIYRGTFSNPLTASRKTLARVVMADMMFLGKMPKSASFNLKRELEDEAERIAAAEAAARAAVESEEARVREATRRMEFAAAGKNAWGM